MTKEPGIDLDFFQDRRISGLLGALVALSGEVMVLKGEVRRLTVALEAKGAVDAAAIEEAGHSPAVTTWTSKEAVEQMRAVLRPILHPDEAIDVRHLMPKDPKEQR